MQKNIIQIISKATLILFLGSGVFCVTSCLNIQPIQGQSLTYIQKRNNVFKLMENADKLIKEGSQESLSNALKTYESGIRLSAEIGYVGGVAFGFAGLGNVYEKLGENETAFKSFMTALNYARQSNDNMLEGIVLNRIGISHHSSGDFKKALEYFTQALDLNKVNSNSWGEINSLVNIGSVYSSLGENRLGIEFYEKALKIAQSTNENSVEAGIINSIGYSHYSNHRLEDAFKAYRIAFDISSKNKGRCLFS